MLKGINKKKPKSLSRIYLRGHFVEPTSIAITPSETFQTTFFLRPFANWSYFLLTSYSQSRHLVWNMTFHSRPSLNGLRAKKSTKMLLRIIKKFLMFISYLLNLLKFMSACRLKRTDEKQIDKLALLLYSPSYIVASGINKTFRNKILCFR